MMARVSCLLDHAGGPRQGEARDHEAGPRAVSKSSVWWALR